MRVVLVVSLLVNVALAAWLLSPPRRTSATERGDLVSCVGEANERARSLDEAERMLSASLPLPALFVRGERDFALERRIGEEIGRVFGAWLEKDGLECRGRVCRVELRSRAGTGEPWARALGEPGLARLVRRQDVERDRQEREAGDPTLWDHHALYLEIVSGDEGGGL